MENPLYAHGLNTWCRLDTALKQAADEGCDTAGYKERADAVLALPDSPEKHAAAGALLDQLAALPPDAALQAAEPSAWADILATLTPPTPRAVDTTRINDRVLGAWLGRCAGCLLGKPFEGARRDEIFGYFEADGEDPDFAYFTAKTPTDRTQALLKRRGELFIEKLDGMPEDDDTNYTALSLYLMEKAGRGFGPQDVAAAWLNCLPIFHTFTAERVAYANLAFGLLPPESAAYLNPYREWIGAQIRTDLYGYVNPGDPLTAAHMAWRDASISHTRNGLYGAMWASAALAEAFDRPDAASALTAALAVVPPGSRFTREIREAMAFHAAGRPWREALTWFTARWDEADPHHWCHTVSNAVIVTFALLYGDGDFGRTIGLATLFGLDTDCNAATAGSIYGALHGAAALPQKWTAPLQDTLYTGVAGWHKVSIGALAQRTAALIPKGSV